MNKIKSLIKLIKKPIVIIGLITVLSQFINLFGYPVIEGDEGVYVGQAWWLVNFGKIAPYTYWYDHFPLGWFQIGLWQKITGGPFTFGLAVFSGRVFVSILVCLTNIFLYLIVEKLTKNSKIAFLSSLFFTLSPLAIFYHRRVLLDNIAVFWLMTSIYYLISAKGRLFRFFLSGLFGGLAFLSKESVIFFLPAFLIGVAILTKKENRSFSILIFLLTIFTLISLFPLLALLKGELFPASWFNEPNHVSLMETLSYQMSRGEKVSFWLEKSEFRFNLNKWLKQDFLLISIGFWSFFINFLFGTTNVRLFVLFGLSYLLFLLRGGLVLDFYIIPLIPFLAASLGLTLEIIVERMKSFKIKLEKHFVPLVLIFILLTILFNGNLFFSEETRNQKEIINYVKQELEPDSVILSSFVPWVDLRLARNQNDFEFQNVEWFYKAELDPEIRYSKLNNSHLSVDYIILSNEMVNVMTAEDYQFIKKVLDNSTLILDLPPVGANSVRDSKAMRTNDASWFSLYKVNKDKSISGFNDLLSSL